MYELMSYIYINSFMSIWYVNVSVFVLHLQEISILYSLNCSTRVTHGELT
ncbi:hypothetical protein HanIR_Chr12g0569081 [Helianthus annuus]|nr:hypothetical protein HanIR_Chr12g0569081 [Helianthus annuus]